MTLGGANIYFIYFFIIQSILSEWSRSWTEPFTGLNPVNGKRAH